MREWELLANGEFKNLAGRTPLVEHEDVCNFVSNRNNGEAFGKDDVTKMFSVVEKRRKQENGLYCIPSKEPSQRTYYRYKTYASCVAPTTLATRVIEKTQARVAAQNIYLLNHNHF